VRVCAATWKRPSTSSSSVVSSRFGTPQTCGSPVGGRSGEGIPEFRGYRHAQIWGFRCGQTRANNGVRRPIPIPPGTVCPRLAGQTPRGPPGALHRGLAGHRSTRSSREGWSLAASRSLIALARARRWRHRTRNLSMTIRLGRVDPDTRLARVAVAEHRSFARRTTALSSGAFAAGSQVETWARAVDRRAQALRCAASARLCTSVGPRDYRADLHKHCGRYWD